jgi:hypothetical protein
MFAQFVAGTQIRVSAAAGMAFSAAMLISNAYVSMLVTVMGLFSG